MIEFLIGLTVAILVFYGIERINSAYDDSGFLIEKAKRIANGEKWDRKEF